MSDNVMLFPNLLQPTAALKTYAPAGVKFWQSQQSSLDDMKEFTDSWFARRQSGILAALQTAQRIGEATTPLDILRECQDWFNGAVGRIVEDGVACQRQMLKAAPTVNAAAAAVPGAQETGERQSG
jgi:hypothetical protein